MDSYDIKRNVGYARFLSILSALFLPLISVFGTTVTVFFNKYIKNFVSLCGLLFLVTTLALVVNVLF